MIKSRSTTKNYFDALAECIERDYGGSAEYVDTVAVKVEADGYTAWAGDVEVFALDGCAAAERCYAWAVQSGDDWEVMTVLGISPVDSAQAAVRAVIAARER